LQVNVVVITLPNSSSRKVFAPQHFIAGKGNSQGGCCCAAAAHAYAANELLRCQVLYLHARNTVSITALFG
jgi:hypothetical protein